MLHDPGTHVPTNCPGDTSRRRGRSVALEEGDIIVSKTPGGVGGGGGGDEAESRRILCSAPQYFLPATADSSTPQEGEEQWGGSLLSSQELLLPLFGRSVDMYPENDTGRCAAFRIHVP